MEIILSVWSEVIQSFDGVEIKKKKAEEKATIYERAPVRYGFAVARVQGVL